MNHNLLIVDDEMEILSWLEEIFRETLDAETGVFTANSAMEALRWLSKVRVDVVLTDIKMPGMDGITLFRHIKENWPRCKVVFLTGYRNFDDMYQIVNHEDVRYILKSEADEVIIKTVTDFLEKSEKELKEAQALKEQEGWINDAKSFLQRALVQGICTGLCPEDYQLRWEKLGIPLDVSEKLLPILLRVEGSSKENAYEGLSLQRKVLEILSGNAPERLKFYLHVLEERQGLLLVQPKRSGECDWRMLSVITQGAIEYTQEQMKQITNLTVSAVIGAEAVGIPELAVALQELKKFMVCYVGAEREVIFRAESVERNVPEETPLLNAYDYAMALKRHMEFNNKDEYFRVLNSALKILVEAQSMHDPVALELYYSISIFLLHFINEHRLNHKIAFGQETYKLTVAEAHADWGKAAEYLTEVSDSIFSLLVDSGQTLADHALKRIVDHIDANLDGELSLTTLADIGGFNTSYLSRLFRQTYGETISDHILHKRMELAKKLLVSTNDKIQDIAVKTGYLSAHSFTRSFRGEFGISPTEYRELNQGAEG